MEFILSFILVIAAIFMGKGKGVTLWVIGSVVIAIMFNQMAILKEASRCHQLWIVVVAAGLTVMSIMISRWWGLLFYFVSGILFTIVAFFVILATTQLY